ncbi:MAG: phage portal protein [Anaerolineae bacterium]|nr:phage portal protein [Anaerolineae bacterium]MDW8300614.1 phage portal protein [Anaerolineae bacterium]
MPPALAYAPNDAALRDAAESELRARRAAYQRACDYYNGLHRRHLRSQGEESDDNVVINLIRQAIDRTVSLLVPRFPTLDLPTLPERNAALAQLWEKNGAARFLAKLAKLGCLSGHVFARVLPPSAPEAAPRLIALNPANVIAFWRADDYEDVLWYELHWSHGRANYRQEVVRADDAWLIHTWQDDSSGWRRVETAVWAYPLPPIVAWQHQSAPSAFYGQPEISNFALNDRVNRLMSDVARILRYHAAPRTVGIGFEARDLTPTAINTLWTIPKADAKVFNLEMHSDLASSMNAVEFLTRAFLAEQRVVVLDGTVADWQRITNLGIRALYMDAIFKIEELRRNYEVGLTQLSQVMRMVTDEPDFIAPVRVTWADPLPTSAAETVEVLARELSLGILSRETAARERGRDWMTESARIAAERTLSEALEDEEVVSNG